MPIYQKYCMNPRCGRFFETRHRHKVYCSIDCRNDYHKYNSKNRIVKVLKKCNWCGTWSFKNKGEAGYCNNEHKVNYEQYIKQKAICRKCTYWSKNEKMCEYCFRTKESRGFDDFPCKKFKKRGESFD